MDEPTRSSVGPYELLGPLAEGGMGTIYRARDPRLGRLVALKFLNEKLTRDPDAVERFLREARAASALNHPNIVTIYETGEDRDGRRFIAMELVAGATLRSITATWSVERFVEVAGQIARALAAAHATGIVHRDIKPENIMVRDDGLVKVVDFGLARLSPLAQSESILTTAPTDAQTLVGTPRYMSPEQVRAERVSPASDIFSFGVVLYEWATGRHPFAGDTLIEVLQAIATAEPPTPSRLKPEVPAALDALILEMLRKDPAGRPTAVAIVERLAGLLASPLLAADQAPTVPLRVGRQAEREAILAAFERAVAGQGVVVGVAGEPGIGKTTLIEDVLQAIKTGGPATYLGRGRCSERLAGTDAYLPFLEALESLLRGDGHDTVSRLLKSVAPTWFAQIAAALDTPADGATEARAGSQERLKRELLTLLEELSRSRPVVLFVDDVHWADPSTVDLIAYLSPRFGKSRILVIATYRPSELRLTGHPFLPLMLDLQARAIAREVDVAFLGSDDVDGYLELAFPGHRFPEAFSALVYERTEGNPLFMVDLVRHLRDREVIRPVADGWELAQDLSDVAQDIPVSIRSLIQRKVDVLDETDRRMLVAASVQGVRFDTAVVAGALEVDPSEAEERFDRLERSHALVELIGEQPLPDGTPSSQYQFVHALYHDDLYNSLRPIRRGAVSAAIARSLETFHAADTRPVAGELALLFETARHHSRAARYFLEAAQKAAAVFAQREAATLARRGLTALSQAGDEPGREQLELELQLALGLSLSAVQGYSSEEVERAYTRARELCSHIGDARRLFHVLEGLWGYYFVKAELTRATEVIEQLLVLAGKTDDRRLLAIAHQSLSFPLLHLGRLKDALDHVQRAMTLDDPEGPERLSTTFTRADSGVRSLSWSALLLWLLGYPDQATVNVRRALARAEASRHPFTQAFASSMAGYVAQYMREPNDVIRHADGALALSLEFGFGQWATISLVLKGWALAELGRADEGLGCLRKGLDAFQRTGAGLMQPYFLSMLAEVYNWNGTPQAGLEAVDAGLRMAERNGEIYWTPELHRVRGMLLLAAGSPDSDVETCLLAALRDARRLEVPILELRAATALSRLWVRQNKHAEARATLSGAVRAVREGSGTRDRIEAETVLASLS
jgi:predicted ATPase/tRNA A-37 threonylcarbamoyl transferase component Bud32